MKSLYRSAAVAALVLSAGGAFAESHGGYVIGISNTVQGNGWREQMVCAMKAEALASGAVASLTSRTATPMRRASWKTSAT